MVMMCVPYWTVLRYVLATTGSREKVVAKFVLEICDVQDTVHAKNKTARLCANVQVATKVLLARAAKKVVELGHATRILIQVRLHVLAMGITKG